METLRELTDFPARLQRCVLSIGKFDGMHLGHAAILSKAVGMAKALNVPAVAFTFDPTPSQILCPEKAPKALCEEEHKIELFESLGLDALILFPTTREFLQTPADDFFKSVIVDTLGASALVEGDNFYFGRAAEGTKERLAELCAEHSMQLEIVQKQYVDECGVSSSRIRKLIEEGEVRQATRLLGRPFELRGVVRKDEQRGRKNGYPTANLFGTTTLLPQEAVYAAAAVLENGEVKPAAVNLGGNPTYGVSRCKIEPHLLDYDGDLYGRPLRLLFLDKLRGIVKFDDEEQLLRSIANDVVRTREIFNEYYSQASK